MAKPKITVTIDGLQGAGKTTLAQHLLHHLAVKHGVRVALNDGAWSGIPSAEYQELPEYFDADVTINVEQK